MNPIDPPRILLVEDEPLIRMLAADMLEMLGYGVIEAGTGGEALDLVAQQGVQGINTLMIDLGLPDMSGEDVIIKLLAMRADLPVIVTTGSDAGAVVARLKGTGDLIVLEKPYQLKDLERAIAPLAKAV
jgi:CheY-like chemotaxis protein